MKECVYLGHKIGNGEVKLDQEKISAVVNYPVPRTKKQVRGFLGLTGYYRKFIQNYAAKAAPLTDLTKKSLPDKVNWSESCEKAFKELKEMLCQTPILRSPDFEKEFILQTDASDIGVGAVLSQLDEEGKDCPLAYYSRKLLPREQKYSTVEKECLAIRLAVEHFRVYLLGKPFTIHTDHRSLVWLNRFKDKNGRLTRWSLALQPYIFKVVHKAGAKNGNADALSRIPTDKSVAGEEGRSVEVQD
jgi:phospholipid-translocating ATPase